MILSLAVAVVLSQSSVKKVEVIRGNSAKKAPKTTETSLNTAPVAGPTAEQAAREKELDAKAQDLDAKSAELNQRAEELKTKEVASEAKKEADAKNQAAGQKILEKHGRDIQREYEKAANALAGEQ